MNTKQLSNIFYFVLLFLVQTIIFNSVEIADTVRFFPYVAFVFLVPITKDRTAFLITSFLLGLSIDIASSSGGINAMSILLAAYLRLHLLKFIMGSNELDYQNFHLRQIPFDKSIIYMLTLCLIHSISIYSLSYFSLNFIGLIIGKGLASGFATFILLLLGLFTFTKPRT